MSAPTRVSRGQLLFGLFFLTIGAIGAVGGWGAYLRDRAIVRTGTRVEARVVRKHVMRDAESGNEYSVDYAFALPDGRRVASTAYLSRREWTTVTVGAALPVLYAPDSPRRSFPEGGGVTSLPLIIFATLLFGLCAVMGFLLLVGARRARSAAP